MRKLFLVRHGDPEFPGREKICLGSTDLPACTVGRMRAALAAWELREENLSAVFSSPLTRAFQSAACVGLPVQTLDGLGEAYQGLWEGLLFSDIRLRWPELYKNRGLDPGLLPPGAEPYEERARRFENALCAALEGSGGDIAVFSHAGVMKAYLGAKLDLQPREFMALPLPYGSVTELWEDKGEISVKSIGRSPNPPLSDGLCAVLMSCAGASEETAAHCGLTAEIAGGICTALKSAGVRLDEGVVRSACLLHDAARSLPSHACVCAGWLYELGYPREALAVRSHMDFDGEETNEAAVVYIADKLACGSRRVTLGERFAASEGKCADGAALAAHSRRRAQAFEVADRINHICAKEIIT